MGLPSQHELAQALRTHSLIIVCDTTGWMCNRPARGTGTSHDAQVGAGAARRPDS